VGCQPPRYGPCAGLLTLPLLVAGIVLADHYDPAMPADHFAVVAHRFDAGAYFHRVSTSANRVSGKTPLERPCPLRQALGVGGRTRLARGGTGLDGSARRPYRPSVAWPGAARPSAGPRDLSPSGQRRGSTGDGQEPRDRRPVTAIVCSKCADRLPSTVTTVQPSSITTVLFTTHVDHGLDSEHHAGAQLGPGVPGQ